VRVRFEGWTFDSDRRELLEGERPAHLSPKAFALLELLIRQRPRAVSKDEIHESVWPRTAVSDSALTSVMAELRRVLGETAHRAIQTKHRFGYAFAAAIAPDPEPAVPSRLRVALLVGSREIPLEPGRYLLGRDPDVEIPIPSVRASRRHARLDVAADGSLMLSDLGSKNGTFVAGSRIAGPVALGDGDQFEIGPLSIRVCRLDRADTETA